MFVGGGGHYGVLQRLPRTAKAEGVEIVSLNQQVEAVDVVRCPGGGVVDVEAGASGGGDSKKSQLNTPSWELMSVDRDR